MSEAMFPFGFIIFTGVGDAHNCNDTYGVFINITHPELSDRLVQDQ